MNEINKEQQQKALALRDELVDQFDEREAGEFINEHQGKSWYDDFLLLYDMITSKDYEITTKTKAIIAGTLAYVVLPIDVIPDFLPVVGWLDDGLVLGITLKTLSEEIENFKLFRNSHESKS